MADTQVLGTCVFGRAGSSPASRTKKIWQISEKEMTIDARRRDRAFFQNHRVGNLHYWSIGN
jgi:hypothetical protein